MFKKKRRKDKSAKSAAPSKEGASSSKGARTTSTSASMLSFAMEHSDDDAEQEFVVKKNVDKKKRKKQRSKDRARAKEVDKSLHSGYGPVRLGDPTESAYSKANLANLQKSAVYMPREKKPSHQPALNDDEEEDDQGKLNQELADRARKQRQEARRKANDFIPLEQQQSFSTTINGERQTFGYASARDDKKGSMIRPGVEDDVPEYYEPSRGGRLAFGASSKESKAMRGGNAHARHDFEFVDNISNMSAMPMEDAPEFANAHSNLHMENKHLARSHAPAPGIPPKPSLTLEQLMESLSMATSAAQQKASEQEHAVNELTVGITEAKSRADVAADALQGLNDRYVFFQALLDDATDILECLQEKSPDIAGAFDESLELDESRGSRLRAQKMLHVQDQIEECFPGLKSMDEQPEVDEFGRVVESQASHARAERQSIRRRRAERRQLRRAGDGNNAVMGEAQEDGWSSGSSDADSDEEDTIVMRRERDQFVADVDDIFADVHDDFATLSPLLAKFVNFRDRYTAQYNQAYIHLSLPALFMPYVKYELLHWNEQDEKQLTLINLSWHQQLAEFDAYDQQRRGKKPNTQAHEVLVLPKILAFVWVPKLASYIEHVWNPLSRCTTRSVMGLVQHTVSQLTNATAVSTSTASKFRQAERSLIDAVINALKRVSSDHCHQVPVIPTDVSSDAQLSFCLTRWHRAWKIAQAIISCRDLEGPALTDLLLEHVSRSLTPYFTTQTQRALSYLQQGDMSHPVFVELVNMATRVMSLAPILSQTRFGVWCGHVGKFVVFMNTHGVNMEASHQFQCSFIMQQMIA